MHQTVAIILYINIPDYFRYSKCHRFTKAAVKGHLCVERINRRARLSRTLAQFMTASFANNQARLLTGGQPHEALCECKFAVRGGYISLVCMTAL